MCLGILSHQVRGISRAEGRDLCLLGWRRRYKTVEHMKNAVKLVERGVSSSYAGGFRVGVSSTITARDVNITSGNIAVTHDGESRPEFCR